MHSRRSYSRWRFLLVPPRTGVENMARDAALQARAERTGETVFSIYAWSRPTLSLGRNQSARGLYDLGKLRDAGIDVVRRPTGGRAILHDREITYSVTAPVEERVSLRDTYARINELLHAGLSSLGVFVESATPSARAATPGLRPCFDVPSSGELIAGGAKLVGSAQWRENGALLQHGSILVDDDQSRLSVFSMNSEGFTQIPAPATLHQLLGRRPEVAEVAEVMFEAVRALEDPEASELEETEVRGEALARVPHFLNEDWTWRR
jgi:lipoyl(octanoyl) transferase